MSARVFWQGYGQDVDDILEAVDPEEIRSELLVLVSWSDWVALNEQLDGEQN